MKQNERKAVAIGNDSAVIQECSNNEASRFRLEERSGIVAIYDTQHPEYADTPGCHADYPWVVCSWKGRYVTPPDPECLNGCGHWTVEKRWIEKACRTLELLNSLCANESITGGGTPYRECNGSALALAKQFHDTYERLAPSFGYETRPETRDFDPDSANGRLMVAVCQEIIEQNTSFQGTPHREEKA